MYDDGEFENLDLRKERYRKEGQVRLRELCQSACNISMALRVIVGGRQGSARLGFLEMVSIVSWAFLLVKAISLALESDNIESFHFTEHIVDCQRVNHEQVRRTFEGRARPDGYTDCVWNRACVPHMLRVVIS